MVVLNYYIRQNYWSRKKPFLLLLTLAPLVVVVIVAFDLWPKITADFLMKRSWGVLASSGDEITAWTGCQFITDTLGDKQPSALIHTDKPRAASDVQVFGCRRKLGHLGKTHADTGRTQNGPRWEPNPVPFCYEANVSLNR